MAAIEEWKKKKEVEAKLSEYKEEGRDTQNNHVTLSNKLVIAGHGLSLPEKRVVCIEVSKMNSRPSAHQGQQGVVKLTVAEYAELAEVDMTTAYHQLKKAADDLFERQITYYTPAYIRKVRIEDTMHRIRWVSRASYQKYEGWIELRWTEDVLPELIGLKKNFTSYQLKQASALRSIYSWRLLELLTKYKPKDGGMARATYDIEDFKASMEVPESFKKDFGQIRRRIIEPAVKELQEKDGWIIEWKTTTAGRRVKALSFAFARDPQGRLF